MEYQEESIAAGIAIFVFVSVALLIATAAVCALWDLRRFGRKGAPWPVALSYAAIFSSFGYWRFGAAGILSGLVCIWAFERGRSHWQRSTDS